MSGRNAVKRLVGGAVCLVLFLVAGHPALAAELHEDPATAEPVYSGVALLDYYTTSLDGVLRKDTAEVEYRLGKIPLAYIPPGLEAATGDFASSGIAITYLLKDIYRDFNRRQELVGQFRLAEAEELTDMTLACIDQAYAELARLREATDTTGLVLGVGSVRAGAGLTEAYNRVLERLDKIESMLALYEKLLENWLAGAGGSGVTAGLKPTEITLRVTPAAAYVGDSVEFSGRLTGGGESLPGREVDILLNGTSYATVITGADGYYGGDLSIPYWYSPELSVQALYYPREADISLYLSSLSPEIILSVLFYRSELEVSLADRAYPGQATPVSGRFDYGTSPPPGAREIEILFDDIVVFRGPVEPDFSEEITLATEMETGRHLVTVSAAASGRYAPVVTSVRLDVSRATPVLELGLPGLVLAPGRLEIDGRLNSEAGPPAGAVVELELGGAVAAVTSASDGEFSTEIKLGLNTGVIGSQDLVVRVSPQEPWHAALVTTRPVLMLNWVNCGLILVALAALGVFLPGVLRRRLGLRLGRTTGPAAIPAVPRYDFVEQGSRREAVPVAVPLAETTGDDGDPRRRIFGFYRRAVRLILKLSSAVFRPQQTLREFAREQSGALGTVARYFMELTGLVERLIYSHYEPTGEDEGYSRELAQTVEEGLKGESL